MEVKGGCGGHPPRGAVTTASLQLAPALWVRLAGCFSAPARDEAR